MRILPTASRSPTELLESLRKRGFVPEFIPAERVIDHMKGSAGNVSAADAFVCLTTYSGSLESELRLNDSARYSTAIKLAEDIRGLPESCAMSDGRKWKSLPFIFLIYELMGVAPAPDARMKGLSVTLVPFDDDDREPAFNLVRTTISEYLQRLLKEMDDLGFLVAYDHGRFKIGPALNPKRGIEGYYYYGPADKRKAGRKLFTVDRDLYGIKYEVEQFEALINNPVVSESDLQRFFEVHPHFLVGSNLAEPIPDPQFTDGDGNVLIPDFVLKPVVAQQRHTKWEILDLKLPTEKLISGPARHRGFSMAVVKAITQLRNYGDYFQNPSNSATVKSVLGHALRYPQLAVLIGRPPSEGQLEELEKANHVSPTFAS